MRLSGWAAVVVAASMLLPALALETQPAAEYHGRRVALAEKLAGGAALIFAADEAQLDFDPYRQDEDFYYLTGWNQPGAALLVEATGAAGAYREVLFLPTRNGRREKYMGVKLDAATPRAAELAGVDEVRAMTELPAELNRLAAGDSAHYLSAVAAHLFTAPDQLRAAAVIDVLSTTLATAIPAPGDVRKLTMQLRMTKSAGEMALLRKAGDASIAAHRALFAAVKPGVSERTLSGLIDYKLKENGCERPSYASIVGSGPNSTTLHYSANSRTMQSGDLVVIDAAGEYSMYASDITRTYPVSGHFTARQREIYDIVLGAQSAARQAFVAGRSILGNTLQRDTANPDNLDKVAFDYINTHGKDLHGQPLGKYFVHSIGHSVGVGVHDPYDYSKPLLAGAVFTIEPGIYIPEENLGVRIEDVMYVEADGKLKDFQEGLPHTADEVEAAMRTGGKR